MEILSVLAACVVPLRFAVYDRSVFANWVCTTHEDGWMDGMGKREAQVVENMCNITYFM